MEIITALGFILVANSLNSPSWWVIVIEVLFTLFSVAIGSVTVTNNLMQMKDWIKKSKQKK